MKCKLCGENTLELIYTINKGLCADCWKHLDCQCGLEKL